MLIANPTEPKLLRPSALPRDRVMVFPVLARAGRIEVRVADHSDEVEQALALRYRVFATELGADIEDPQGLDRDIFDPYCRHLIARDTESGRVIGTYRALLPEDAQRLGFLYMDREFVLSWLAPLRSDLVEFGRACIDPAWRNGVVLMMLWRGMREFVSRYGHQYVVGCCSVPARDGGVAAARLYRHLAKDHLAPPNQRVWPRNRLSIESLADASGTASSGDPVDVPALLKGYLKAGARILGEPHVDPQFGCADLPVMLEVRSLDSRLSARLG